MGLSSKEIDQLIKKLRERYRESAAEYKSRVFNLEAFEDRYKTALIKRMNLEGFILAEIANYEKIKEKCEEERHPKEPEISEFSKQVNQIIEGNTAKIAKYLNIQFHPHAGPEISRLYGALSDFAQSYFSILWTIIADYENKEKLHAIEQRISEFAVMKSKKHPKRIEDHILVLARNNVSELEIEKHKNNYLKESAFLLYDIIEFMELLITVRSRDWENPLKFDKLFVEAENRKKIMSVFSGMTPYGAILAIKERAEEILKDFRLESFRRKQMVV
jgi:hypothetical protein